MKNTELMQNRFIAGAAFTDITPHEPHFLHGYPLVERTSTGTHDPLLSSALYVTDGREQVLFISNDVLYVSKDSVARIRQAIYEKKAIPASHILIAATHTHSGPVTVDLVISRNDPVVPKADKNYLKFMEESVVDAACRAIENAEPAEMAFQTGDATGIGSNRRSPDGASDREVPILLVRNKSKNYIACLLVCNMHPTVLHEDSTLYSSDFYYFTRKTLQQDLLGEGCPVICFTGTAGNQSPRHVTQANTFEEAQRIGTIVAQSLISKASENLAWSSALRVQSVQTQTGLPKRKFPAVEWAQQQRDTAKHRLEKLKKSSKNPQEIRTAEVDWFGSEELLFLSQLAQSNQLESVYASCLPAEIQIITIGNRKLIAWPGEVFVEYGLELKRQFENIALITYANGELQGYIVTKEADEQGWYEAGNSLFNYSAGKILSDKTVELIKKLNE